MREINTKITNGKVIYNIEYTIEYKEVLAITNYIEEMVCEIIFKNEDIENYYNDKLLDSTGAFKYTNCDTLFSLGILTSCSFDGDTEFGFTHDYKERLTSLNRLNVIDKVLDYGN